MAGEVVAHPAAEDQAAKAIAEANAQYQRAKAQLAAFLQDAPTGATYKDAANAIVWKMMVKIMSGDLEPKTAREAADVAEKIAKLVDGRDLAAVGEAVAKIDDPNERRQLLADLKKTAQERALGNGSR